MIGSNSSNRHQAQLLTVIFFTSGAAGLVYEILWTRLLALTFGATHLAVTTVLAAFMAGLALGSWILGRFADRSKQPLVIYAALETGIGIYAFLTPRIVHGLNAVHGYVYAIYAPKPLVFIAIRVVLCVLVLIIPTVLMGGTLPLLARHFVRQSNQITARVGFLYGINTIGAFVGSVAAGFVLIRWLGVTATLYSAGAVNIALGICAGLLFYQPAEAPVPAPSRLKNVTSPRTIAATLPTPVAASGTTGPLFPIIAYLVSGFAALACEVAWTRGLTLVLGSSVYAFTLMLAAILGGIGCGSWGTGKLHNRIRDPLQAFAFAEVIIGFSVLVSVVLLGQLPVLYLLMFFRLPRDFFALETMKFFLAVAVMAVPTIMMGAAFPLISRIYAGSRAAIGGAVGDIYSVNTIGGILGSAATGFFLIPFVGTRLSLMIAGVLFLAVGMSAFLVSDELQGKKKGYLLGLLALLSVVMVWRIPSWNPLLMTSGVYVYAPEMKDGFEANRKFLFFEEGVHSLVAVTEKNGVRSLRINGKTDGSNSGDMVTQVLLAETPLCLHRQPRTALIVGLGTGVTAGAALSHELRRVDCIEIDQSVVRASRYFAAENHEALSNPRLNLIIGDARTVLAQSHERYDVIIAEPSNPWITGVSNLFTEEHFQLYRSHLQEDGILCQWIHSYYMRLTDLTMIFRTLLAVFPHVSLWEGSPGDFLLVASGRQPEATSERLAAAIADPNVAADLQRIQIRDAGALLSRRLLGDQGFRFLAGNGAINTDDRPLIEFSAPQAIYAKTDQNNRAAIETARQRFHLE